MYQLLYVYEIMHNTWWMFVLICVPTRCIRAEGNCNCYTVHLKQCFASSSSSCHWCLPQHCYGGARHHPGFGVQSCRSAIHHWAELSVDLSWGLLWCRSSWSWVGSQDPTGQHLGGECTQHCKWRWGLYLYSNGQCTTSGNHFPHNNSCKWVMFGAMA